MHVSRAHIRIAYSDFAEVHPDFDGQGDGQIGKYLHQTKSAMKAMQAILPITDHHAIQNGFRTIRRYRRAKNLPVSWSLSILFGGIRLLVSTACEIYGIQHLCLIWLIALRNLWQKFKSTHREAGMRPIKNMRPAIFEMQQQVWTSKFGYAGFSCILKTNVLIEIWSILIYVPISRFFKSC